MDKKNDIERLLQAVETPEIFDEKELDAIMNDEGTKEFYSLLCDIESVKSIDNAPFPDVNAEWNNFVRWMRKRRKHRPARRLLRLYSWQAYISVAAVILFALFIATSFILNDSSAEDTIAVNAKETCTVGSTVENEQSELIIGEYDEGKSIDYFDYKIIPAHRYTLPTDFFNFQVVGNRAKGVSGENLEYLFENFTILDKFMLDNIDIGRFDSNAGSNIELLPARILE